MPAVFSVVIGSMVSTSDLVRVSSIIRARIRSGLVVNTYTDYKIESNMVFFLDLDVNSQSTKLVNW